MPRTKGSKNRNLSDRRGASDSRRLNGPPELVDRILEIDELLLSGRPRRALDKLARVRRLCNSSELRRLERYETQIVEIIARHNYRLGKRDEVEGLMLI